MRTLIALALLFMAVVSASADDAINTIPSRNSSFYTDLNTFLGNELGDRWDEIYSNGWVTSGCTNGGTSGSQLTVTACVAYTHQRVSQAQQVLDFIADHGATAADTCWVALHEDTTTAIGGWSRKSGTHFLVDCTSATQPSTPSNSVMIAQVDLASSSITTVTDLRLIGPLMPQADQAHSSTTDIFAETLMRAYDIHPAFVTSGCAPAVPSSSLTIAAFACTGYVRDGSTNKLVYINQAAVAVTIADATPTWLALDLDTSRTVSGWTRVTGTHYIYKQAASQPADPSGAHVFAQVTVAGSVVTAVSEVANMVLSGTETISVSRSRSNGVVEILPGASFSISSGKTLTLDCSKIVAGDYPIFSGAGTVTCSGGDISRGGFPVAWTGALGDGATEYDEIAMGINSGAMHIAFDCRTYLIDTTLVPKDGQRWSGCGAETSTVISMTATTQDGVDLDSVGGVTIENMHFQGPGEGTGTGVGIKLDDTTAGAANNHFEHVRVSKWGSHGWYVDGASNVSWSNVEASNNGGSGWHCLGNSDSMKINNGYFAGNTVDGMHFTGGCQNVAIDDANMEGNGANGVGFDGSFTGTSIVFKRAHIEGNLGRGVNAVGGGVITLFGSDIRSNDADASGNDGGAYFNQEVRWYGGILDGGDFVDFGGSSQVSLYNVSGTICTGSGTPDADCTGGMSSNDTCIGGSCPETRLSTTQTDIDLGDAITSILFGSGNTQIDVTLENTQDITTTAKTVVTAPGDNGSGCLIVGKQLGGSPRFLDFVIASNTIAGDATAIKQDTFSTAATRTYSNGPNALLLAMSTSTYNTLALCFKFPNPD